MFAAWGTWVARHRWPVLAVALAAVIGAGVWGLGVFGQLTEGGYNDPNSESTRAGEVVQAALGAQGADIVVIYTPKSGTIDNPVLGQRIETKLAALPRSAVSSTDSYWSGDRPQYASADKSSAVAVATLAGQGDGDKLDAYKKIAGDLSVEGATEQVAGGAALQDASSTRSTKDLGMAEAVSLPVVLILLLFIFGSLVAAALPVLVGGAAVLGSLGVLHAVSLGHDVNSFAVNVASLLGLGMAIDYGLFIVGRFREEQAFGRTTEEAVGRAIATAGRTVVFSATLLMIALAGLLLFPQDFLKSLAYGGLSAVALAAILSLTLLPAILAILGPRVDKLPVRLPARKNAKPAGAGWARFSDRVLSRPVLFALPILAGLLLLAAPIRGVHFGENDERVLPAAEPARQAIEALKADFPALSSAGVQVVLRGPAPDKSFAASVAKVDGIAAVTQTGAGGQVLVFTATLKDHDPFSQQARDAVQGIRALTPPANTQLLVGGATARNVDSLQATADRLPLMISLLVGATLLLMFLAFGSILLPIKAVVVSALSLSATFGVLVWIFQDGHGAGFLNVTPAPLEAGIVVLMGAVVFGLSTDYEVFLLSRMVEARTRGASTPEAVATGLARTGRVISAAAVLLIVVTGAFALSSITTMRFVGVGMIIALFLDATVVRMLLVPAILKLLGDAAWWAPGPLRRLQERAGLTEYAGEELFPTISVGRHAAPDSAVARPVSTAAPRHASGAGRWAVSGAAAGSGATAGFGAAAASGAAVHALPAAPARAALPAGPTAVPVAVPVITGEKQTVRVPTGEQPAIRTGAIYSGTGEHEPISGAPESAGTHEPVSGAPAHPGTHDHEPVSGAPAYPGTSASRPMSGSPDGSGTPDPGTGEHQPVSGAPAFSGAGGPDVTSGESFYSGGGEPVGAGRWPIRVGTGEQSAIYSSTGERTPVHVDGTLGATTPRPSDPASGGDPSLASGDGPEVDGRPLPSTGTGDQAQVRFGTGERPRVMSLRPSGNPANDTARQDPPATTRPATTDPADIDSTQPVKPASPAPPARITPEPGQPEPTRTPPTASEADPDITDRSRAGQPTTGASDSTAASHLSRPKQVPADDSRTAWFPDAVATPPALPEPPVTPPASSDPDEMESMETVDLASHLDENPTEEPSAAVTAILEVPPEPANHHTDAN